MGIAYTAKMLVGVRANQVPLKEGEELCDFVEEHGLVECSEKYDGSIRDRIVGYECPNNVKEEDLEDFFTQVRPLFKKLKDLTGIEPNLIATQDVY